MLVKLFGLEVILIVKFELAPFALRYPMEEERERALGLVSEVKRFLGMKLQPLRRRVVVGGLEPWLNSALQILGPNHPASAELAQLRKQIQLLSAADVARAQVAKFYKSWYDLIASTDFRII